MAYLQNKGQQVAALQDTTAQRRETKKFQAPKKKKKQLFKGNTTAKTCLIKNKDLIASQMIPRLQHRNENTYQVYSFRVTGRSSKAYLGKSSKRLQDTSSEDRY